MQHEPLNSSTCRTLGMVHNNKNQGGGGSTEERREMEQSAMGGTQELLCSAWPEVAAAAQNFRTNAFLKHQIYTIVRPEPK